jgi:hypothetical protein
MSSTRIFTVNGHFVTFTVDLASPTDEHFAALERHVMGLEAGRAPKPIHLRQVTAGGTVYDWPTKRGPKREKTT